MKHEMNPETREQWVPGFEGSYSIDINGDVWSWTSLPKKKLKPIKQKTDYYNVSLLYLKNGKKTHASKLIQSLMRDIFMPPKPGPNYVVTHKDWDYKNNALSNLEWVPRKDVYKRTRGGRLKRPVDVWNVQTGEYHEFDATVPAVKFLGITGPILQKYSKSKQAYRGIWRMKQHDPVQKLTARQLRAQSNGLDK